MIKLIVLLPTLTLLDEYRSKYECQLLWNWRKLGECLLSGAWVKTMRLRSDDVQFYIIDNFNVL